jgi:hypothetical protein
VPPEREEEPPNSSDMPLPFPECNRIVRIRNSDAMMSITMTTEFSTTGSPLAIS